MQEWCDVIEHCEKLPVYALTHKQKRFVSMYDLNDLVVKPWTKGTGCGLSIMMSQQREQEAKLMVSHAWGEDVEECMAAMKSFFDLKKISYSTPIWFVARCLVCCCCCYCSLLFTSFLTC